MRGIVRGAVCAALGAASFAALPAGISTAADDTAPQDAADAKFDAWLDDVRADAMDRGVSIAILDEALADVRPDTGVIEKDRNQPEFTITFENYVTARVSPARIERGRKRVAEHRESIEEVATAYGVQARFIAAIWGMETNYGSFTGGHGVVRSLVTLAYDDRRPTYFRGELLNALQILQEKHIAPSDMLGSWAGAMGQSQFMPSSFLSFAQDYDGDGRRDIWTTEADVFASIANYLKHNNWRGGMTWGKEVTLPDNFAALEGQVALQIEPKYCRRALKDHSRKLSLAEWNELGLTRKSGASLPVSEMQAALVRPDGGEGRAFLVSPNFRSILSYNCSNFYALAVGLLADELDQPDRGQAGGKGE